MSEIVAFDGARLIELARAAGISQNELARKAGLASPSITDFVRGYRKPRLETAARLAAVVGVDVATLWREKQTTDA